MQTILYILFGLLLLTPVTGELFRIPVFGFDLLPSDLIILALLVVWIYDKFHNDRVLRVGRLGRAVTLFWAVLLVTFLFNGFRADWHEMISAGAYLARYTVYLTLPLIAYDLLEREAKRRFSKLLFGALVAAMLLICILGFLQLIFFPNFLDLGMDVWGWDPHIGRLVSTWLDPNYVGGFLAFALSVLFAVALSFRQKRDRRMFWILAGAGAIGFFALYLTYSRSALLTFLVSVGILSFLKSRKLLAAVLILLLLGFGLSARVRERTADAWDSGKAFLGLDSQRPLDPTAQLRVRSWENAVEIIGDHPFIGIGYNRYKAEYNRRGFGLLSDHASGGSDSSLLTIWATSGFVGLLSFLWIGFMAVVVALRRSWKKADLRSYIDAGLLAGFGGMMIHSIFVNSLLYPLIMVYLLVGVGVMDEK